MEEGDLLAVDAIAREGFDVLKRLGRVAAEHKLDHRAVFRFQALWQKALKDLGEVRFLPRRRPQ